jgi:hypothetical protein
MTTPADSPSPEVKEVQKEIDATIQAVDKQEIVVEKAEGTPKEKEEQDKYAALLAKFDTLTERLNAIDSRLAEPTVPAPPAKEAAPVVDNGATPVVEETVTTDGGKPKKRRLGAWG